MLYYSCCRLPILVVKKNIKFFTLVTVMSDLWIYNNFLDTTIATDGRIINWSLICSARPATWSLSFLVCRVRGGIAIFLCKLALRRAGVVLSDEEPFSRKPGCPSTPLKSRGSFLRLCRLSGFKPIPSLIYSLGALPRCLPADWFIDCRDIPCYDVPPDYGVRCGGKVRRQQPGCEGTVKRSFSSTNKSCHFIPEWLYILTVCFFFSQHFLAAS